MKPVFAPQDLQFFDENGYVVLRNAVPKANAEAVVADMIEFLGISPQPDESWYRPPVSKGGGMVEMYQRPSMWNNRQHPRVHAAFAQLWQREDLWVSIDRVSLKPPCHADHPDYQKTGFLHLDASTDTLPIPFRLQGVLYLSDTAADQGGFHCLPGWHKRTEAWLKAAGPKGSLSGEEMYQLPVKPIPANAGDLLIWHVALPHGNGWNNSNRPRFAQYITMYPAGGNHSRHPQKAEDRVAAWQEHTGPVYAQNPFPGDPRGWERQNGETAALTDLGEKLLGLKPWPSRTGGSSHR